MYQSSLRTYRRLLLLGDGLAALAAMAGTMVWAALPLRGDLLLGAVVALVAGLAVTEGYNLRRIFRIADEVVSVLAGSAIAVALLAAMIFFLGDGLSRTAVLRFGGGATLLSVALRIAIRQLYKRQGAPRLPRTRVLVLGEGALGRAVSDQLRERDWLGIELVAPGAAAPLEAVESLIEQQGVEAVVVALSLERTAGLSALVERLHHQVRHVYLLPDLHPVAALPTRMEMFGGMALLSLSEQVMAPWQALVKRGLDILVSVGALILLSPLLLTVALLIALSSRGPILFAQERVGEHGRPFRMLKFRTMVHGAEQAVDDDGSPLLKRRDDPRVTPLGRWLRRFSVDELPQLWNILRGEMSLVGPRPELPWLVAQYEPWQRRRLLVPQGLTGWWQINGRSDKPMHLHTEDDLYYVRNFSLRLDLEILWKTVWVVLRGQGAY